MNTTFVIDEISTRWSQIQDPLRFVMRYSEAIRAYLVALLRDNEAAEEACQEFLARFLERGLKSATPDRGRFRDYLKVSVRNTAISLLRRKQPAQVEQGMLETLASTSADDAWLREWQRVVLEKAWRELESHEHASPGCLYFTALRLSVDHPDETSERLAARATALAGRPVSAAAFRQQLSRGRRRFAESILHEVAQTLTSPSPKELAEELAELGLWPYVKGYLPAAPAC